MKNSTGFLGNQKITKRNLDGIESIGTGNLELEA